VLITAKIGDGKGAGDNIQARLVISDRKITGKLIATIEGPQSIKVGDTAKYKVSVIDSNGKKVDGSQFDWRLVPDKLGTLTGSGDNAILNAKLAGRGVLMVEIKTSQGTVTGRLSITVDKK
jgi:hypothetical protein